VVSEQKNVFGILQTGDALARLDPTASPRELGQAVIAALAAYRENVPGQLYVQGVKRPPDPLLKFSGSRSWKALEKNAQYFTVSAQGSTARVTPSMPGKTGGFLHLSNQGIESVLAPDEVGSAILGLARPQSVSSPLINSSDHQRYSLKEVMSGAAPSRWVTLGFTSTLEANDVLHIVASEHAGEEAGPDRTLYVERSDQAYSAERGARAVHALANSVEVELTAEAQRALRFSTRLLSFDGAEQLPGYADARRIFKEMAQAGYPVELE
jgi:hypothetical protein